MPVKPSEVAYHAEQGKMNTFAFGGRAVIVNKGTGQEGNQHVVAQALLDDTLRNRDAFNTADFSTLAECEFDKAVLNVFPANQFAARFRYIPHGVSLIPLDGFLPRNTAPGLLKRSVEIVRVNDLGKIIKPAEPVFLFRGASGFYPVIPRFSSFFTCQYIFPFKY
jgi:hypothetical protein